MEFFRRKYIKSLNDWNSVFNLASSTCSVVLNFTSGISNLSSTVISYIVFALTQGQFAYSNRELRKEITGYETKLIQNIEEAINDAGFARNEMIRQRPVGFASLGLDNSTKTKTSSYLLIAGNLITATSATAVAIAANETRTQGENDYCTNYLCIASYSVNALALILMVSEQHVKRTNLVDYMESLKEASETPVVIHPEEIAQDLPANDNYFYQNLEYKQNEPIQNNSNSQP